MGQSTDNQTKKSKHKEFVFTQESLKKKFRLSEYLAEKIISSVAFLSIAIIVLIFIFVFRESIPAGKSKETQLPKKTDTTAISPTNANKQETYGSEDNKALKPESYGSDDAGKTKESKPESYGSSDTTSAEVTNSNHQEQYGVTTGPVDSTGAPILDQSVPVVSSEPLAEDNRPSFRNLLGRSWMPVSDNPRYGLLPLIIGTFKITFIAIMIAAPLAILAALFSATYAPNWLREIIKPAIELLAGFPSVVIGFFALMVMATFFQDWFGYSTRLNSFVGGVALALAAIPIIFTLTEDALTSIPKSYSEASLALGATKWQTAFFVVLPAAIPGIFAAILLGIGRVFGETMIALMATGNAALMSANPFESVRTLAATIGAEMAEVVFGDTHYSVLFLIGSLLFVFTFAINAIAEFYIKGKLMKRFQGKTS